MLPKKVDYDVEKSDPVILPPATIQPEPVIITVPEKHESVYGFHTKEIIHLMPEKPTMRDVAVQTDPWTQPELTAPIVPAPPIKRKKVVKKPKKMFIPANADPMDSIEEDIGAEIAIDMPQSPGARSVAPLGDMPDPVPMAPLNFTRNPKPVMPEHNIPHDEIPVPPRGQHGGFSGQPKPNIPDNDEFDPRGLRSPPIPANDNNGGAPRRMTFSPIADESDEETGARIPSPPRERKNAGPRNNGGTDTVASEPRPTLKNQRLNEMSSPTAPGNAPVARSPAAPAKSPVTGGAAPTSTGSNNPFANLGGPSTSPAAGGEQGGGGPGPNDDLGMRAARGRLGGAVRGGGGGGEAPSGWKPWAKGGARR